MNAVELLDRATQSAPERDAIIDGCSGHERVLSYASLVARSRRLASVFAEAGLQPGDGVAIMLPMSAELYVVIAAAWRLGLVPVFMDPAAGNEHFTRCARSYPIRAFVGTPAACWLRLSSSGLRNIPVVYVASAYFPGARSLRAASRYPLYEGDAPGTADAPAMLSFTSGSTGRPKGILRRHGLLLATHRVLSAHLRPRPGEVALATMPVFTLTYLACGATCLIPDVDLRRPGSVDPGRLAQQMENRHVTTAVISSAMLERLADYCLARHRRLDALKVLFVGGAPVFPRLLDKLARVAPGARLFILYGSTEAEPMALLPSAELGPAEIEQMMQGRGLLVGRPIPEISLRILGDRWGEVRAFDSPGALEQGTVRQGEGGEIVVAGAHVAQDYLDAADDAEANARVGSVVWHRTGDAGWRDELGRLWLLGRCSARIEDSEGTLYPYAVEAALSAHPDIERSALISYRGERLLVLQLYKRHSPDVRAIIEQLAWARIAAVVLVKKIPLDRRHNAKVDYPKLRQLLDKGKWAHRIGSAD